MTEEERHDSSVSRRTMLKRIGIAGAVAWVTPVVTSLNTPAFAASGATGACSQCAGDFCLGQTACGGGGTCGCAQRVDGNGCFCYGTPLNCDQLPRCTAQSDCSGGDVCVHTCCDAFFGNGQQVCIPACLTGQSHTQGSSGTQSGVGPLPPRR